jgi:polar amino acid transport system substrate-binding protein
MKIAIVFLLILLNSMAVGGNHIVLKLRWKHSFQFAGYYMAKEKGFYKKAGLDVEIQELKNGESVVGEVLYNKADFGIGGSSLIYSKLLGNPIKILIPVFKNSPLALLTTNKDIKSIKDIKEKSIMASPTSLQNISLLSMLQISDIKPNDINIKENVFNVDDILKNKADLYTVFLSNQPYYLKEKNIPYTVFDPSKYGLDFYGDILFTSKNKAIKSQKTVQAFINATKKGWKYALSHISETIRVIKEKYNTQNFSTKALTYQAGVFKDIVSKDFIFDRQKIMEAERLYKVLFKNSNSIDYENFIFNPFIANDKEKNFIKTHKIICISTGNWAPFNLMKNGKLVGIALDYWHIVKKRLGLEGECKTAENFTQVLNAIKDKKADITASTTNTKEREKYAVFSKPYAKFPVVIVTRNSVGFVPDIKSIKNKLFALPKDYTFSKILLRDYPGINYVEVKNIDQALEYVSKGKADVAVGILPVVAYKINDLKYTNLKISGTAKYTFPVRFMIRKDYRILAPMINRVIDSIKESEKEKIYQKWVTVHMQEGYSKEKVLRYSIVAIIVFILLLFWMITLFVQIQKRKKAEKALEKLATIDKLTCIYNRYMIDNSLSEQIEIAKRYNKHLSIIFFDIDHFKEVNDIYGHKAGDTVLRKLSDLVKNKKRKSDIFGRWGGEEFMLVLPETDIKRAELIAQTLREEIEKYYFEKVGHITCSFGVTQTKKEDTMDTLMKRVDEALYRAKKEGRNRVIAS